jgi:hypothetical protein
MAIALAIGCAAEDSAETPTAADTGWDTFVDQYVEAHLAAHPLWAVVQGRHEYDGRFPDWSADGIAREIERLHAARDEANAFPVPDLTDEQRFERDYLIATIDGFLFWLEKAEWPFRNPGFYFNWQVDELDPSPYITRDYAPIAERMAAYTRFASNVPAAAAQIQTNLRIPMPRTYLKYGVASFRGLGEYFLNDVPQAWAEVADPELQAAFETANAAAAAAMLSLADWLESHAHSATEDFALGPELFAEMLYDTERVGATLEELEAIARADFVRNQAALAEACAAFAPGASIVDCFAQMADRKPEGGAVDAARGQLDELEAFLREADLVSIPGTEEALVEEAPPFARSNFAYISTAGPYDEGQPSIYYIAPPDPAWPDDVQWAYIPGEADLLFTSVHEVWPGHFLNLLHGNRSDRMFGRLFWSYAFGEGWAHYTEELMLEAGLRDGSPETQIGQLSNALLRNVRFLSALGLHTQGMSVAESERLFIEEGYQDEGTARQQAARGTRDPAYLNYTLGKLLIRKLRDDWTASRGGREAWREFHDTFLSYGIPPIPLVRGAMMGGEAEAVFP